MLSFFTSIFGQDEDSETGDGSTASPTSPEVQRFPLTSTLSPINADDEEWLRKAASFCEDSEGASCGGIPMDPCKVLDPQSFYPKSALTPTLEDPLPLSLLPLLPLEPAPRQELPQMLKQDPELAVYQDLLQKLSHAVRTEELQGCRRSETQSFYGRRPVAATAPWQSFYGAASQSRFSPSESSRSHAWLPLQAPLHVERIPTVNPWKERGRLVEALSLCGLVFLRTDGLPEPSFDRWEQLWREALWQTPSFRRRPLVTSSHLRFSQGEDLLRTRSGEQKQHTPDVRYNFGLGLEALRQASKRWGDLQWMRMELMGSFNALSAMLTSELFAVAPLQQEPPGSLGALVAKGTEYYKGSRMRHCIYPSNGSCTEHTDYGLVTFQQSSAQGLEAFLQGQWVSIEPPDTSTGVLFAGDMLERITNGKVPALLHRVTTAKCSQAPTSRWRKGKQPDRDVVRQSQIFFLQPDRDTIVRPLWRFCTGDPAWDYAPVRYGDWQKSKTRLAFNSRPRY